ncbi:Crp/Fnr family transcriptional regulator [Caulobacter segnis]
MVCALPPARRALLLRHARSRAFEPGALIYGIGDPPNGLWAVVEGQVRLKGYPAAGLEFLAMVLRPGTWFGEVSTLDGGPRPYDASALGRPECSMCRWRISISWPTPSRLSIAILACWSCQHQRAALEFIARDRVGASRCTLGPAAGRTAKGQWQSLTHAPGRPLRSCSASHVRRLSKRLQGLAKAGVIRLSYAQIEVLAPGDWPSWPQGASKAWLERRQGRSPIPRALPAMDARPVGRIASAMLGPFGCERVEAEEWRR